MRKWSVEVARISLPGPRPRRTPDRAREGGVAQKKRCRRGDVATISRSHQPRTPIAVRLSLSFCIPYFRRTFESFVNDYYRRRSPTLQSNRNMRWWWLIPLALVVRGTPSSQTVTFSMRKLAFSTNQFGIDLYRALNASENVALCPFCVGSSLAMLLLGAEGSSAMALRQSLYLWGLRPHDIHAAYRDLTAHLGTNLTPEDRRTEEEDNALRIVNQLYVQRHFSVHYPFQYMLNRFYNTSIQPLDFVMNADQSTRYINSYFSMQTAGKAGQMLSRVPSPSTNLLLLSALYFRGTLDMDMGVFREEGRDQSPFTLMQARRARVRYGSHDYLNCTAVEVPFRGGLISLLALLPNDPGGMPLLETRLSAQRLADILNVMEVDTVDFQMPRIVVSQTQGHNLTRALYHLGLVDLFTPGHANLFGVSPFGWLHLTNVTHASYVEVREEGRRNDSPLTATEGDPAAKRVLLDRPFLWFVMDNVAGLAIAMGKMAWPESD